MSDHPLSTGATGSDTETDDIVELTDVVEDWEGAFAGPVIELTDVVAMADGVIRLEEPEPARAEEAPPAEEAARPGELSFGDLSFSDIDAPEVAADVFNDSLGMRLEAGIPETVEDSEELDFSLTTEELSEAIDQFDTPAAPVDFTDSETARDEAEGAVSPRTIEAAVEKVIRERYAEKIDLLIETAIERIVSADIDRLKARLLDDDEEMD